MPDLSDYQSAETAWRYDARRGQLVQMIEDREAELADLRLALDELERNPPMRHLFNWSA